MSNLEYIYNNFNSELVSFEQDHSKLEKYIINIPEQSSKERFFIRKRSLGIKELLSFMIMPRAESLRAELEDFAIMSQTKAVSKSAFSQRRNNISSDILVDLNKSLINVYYNSPLPRKWKGRYLIAVDGTTVSMPRGKRYEKMFGIARNSQSKEGRPTARSVFVVDALNHVVLASALVDFDSDEPTVAWELISRLPQNILNQSIFLFDRLYPSSWLLTLLYNNSIQFVMRCRTNFSPEIDRFFDSPRVYEDVKVEVSATAWTLKTKKRYEKMGISLENQRPLFVKLSKSKLSTGETEVIISSVFGIRISAMQAYRIYGCRWGVETVIGEEKNEEQIEIFSGRKKDFVRQDFFAKIISHNLIQISANSAQHRIRTRQRKTGRITQKTSERRPPEMKVNMNLALYYFRLYCVRLLEEPTSVVLTKFLDVIAMNVVPVIPGRHFPRVFIAYKLRGKYATFANYARVI